MKKLHLFLVALFLGSSAHLSAMLGFGKTRDQQRRTQAPKMSDLLNLLEHDPAASMPTEAPKPAPHLPGLPKDVAAAPHAEAPEEL